LNQQFRQRQFPAGNPLANALVVIVGIIVISLSLALGVFVFLAVSGFVLVMAVAMSIRNWWFRRKMAGKPAQSRQQRPSQPASRQIIEGEYQRIDPEDQ
jgi:uncharacterized membrane protein YphA (DoxX/SURF4 family)